MTLFAYYIYMLHSKIVQKIIVLFVLFSIISYFTKRASEARPSRKLELSLSIIMDVYGTHYGQNWVGTDTIINY